MKQPEDQIQCQRKESFELQVNLGSLSIQKCRWSRAESLAAVGWGILETIMEVSELHVLT